MLDKSLHGLGKWAARSEWDELFMQTFELHVAEVCERADMDYDDIAEVIGEYDARLVWQCAFEDFLARRFEPDGRNVVDDYLKRRGWKESATHKRRMEALREAVMSLYQVEKVAPDRSLTMRDLIRGGEPVIVSDAGAGREIEVGDRIGARILVLPDRNVLSAGWLPFGKEAADMFTKQLKPEMKRARREFSRLIKENQIDIGKQNSADASDFVFLMGAAPAFSMVWLSERIAEELNENMPAILAEAGDDLALCRLYFPLRPGAKAAALRKRLSGHADLSADGPDFWNWIGSEEAGREHTEDLRDLLQMRLEDGTLVLGNVELLATELKLTTMWRNLAEQGKAIILDLAGDLLEEPRTTIETLDDTESEQLQGTLDFPAETRRSSRSAAGRRSATARRR